MRGVPEGWIQVRIGDVAHINPPRSKPDYADSTPLVFVPMPRVAEEFGGIDVSERRPFSSIKRGYTQFQPGDVLFAKITPCMENGKIAIVPEIRPPLGYGSTEFFVMRPRAHGLSPWIAHCVAQSRFRDLARKNMQGAVGQRRVPKVWVKDASVPLAPLPEQHRIVAKIESLFAKLDEGVAALKRAEANLERYRASVLKAAVEGRLTEQWRCENPAEETGQELLARTPVPPRPSRYRTRFRGVIAGHPALSVGATGLALPERWSWAPLVDVARLESGHTPSRRRPDWWDGYVPWVGIKDARAHHGGTIFETVQMTNKAGLANSAARLLPTDTVCLSRTASVGYVVRLGRPMATSQDFVNWICTEALDPRWLQIVFLADPTALRRFGKGSTHTTVYFPEVLSLHIALPPLAEQRAIVAEVDSRLNECAKQGILLAEAQERASILRQSILKRAFEGGLVPQDPADEPASVLLERIRAEREAKRKRNNRRRAKPRRQRRSRVP